MSSKEQAIDSSAHTLIEAHEGLEQTRPADEQLRAVGEGKLTWVSGKRQSLIDG